MIYSPNHDVVITVLGGCVNGVFTDLPDVKVALLDWDNINDYPSEALSIDPARCAPSAISEMPADTRQVYEDYVARFPAM